MKNIGLFFRVCFILIFTLSTAACSDDDAIINFPGGTEAKLIPVKIYGEKNGGITSFTYDDDNRIINCSYSFENGGKLSKYSEYTIEYDDNDNINRVVYQIIDGDTFIYTMTYEESCIIMKDKFYTSYIYIDSQNRVLKVSQSNNSNEELYFNYDYDNKGNLIRHDINGIYYSYSYDERNGIFNCVNTPQWFLVFMLNKEYHISNNCNEITTYYLDENGDKKLRTTFELTYTYNDNGYPTKYHVPNMSFCGTPPLPESDFRVEYKEAKDIK